MREIKFRAWHKKKRILVRVLDLHWGLIEEDADKPPLVMHAKGGGHELSAHTREDYILMQYTGLKDKNGKEIFEGDVVQQKYSHGHIWKREIKWFQEDCGFGFKGWPIDFVPLQEGNVKEYEVIGNIYENPDLLEEK